MRGVVRSLLFALLATGAAGCGSLASLWGGGDKADGASSIEPAPPARIEIDRAEAARLNLQLGIGYIRSGQYAVALDKLKKSLEYNDDSAEAHNAIGLVYEELRDYPEAERHYAQAVALKPGYQAARANLARFQCARGRGEEGEQRFLALATDPGSDAPEAMYVEAAICARSAGAPARAEADLRRALELSPDYPRALYESAALDYAQRRYESARATLARLFAVNGPSPASLLLAIRVEDALGDGALRRDYAQQLLSRFGNSPEARELGLSR